MFGGAGLALVLQLEHFLRSKCLEQIHLQDYQLLCLHWDRISAFIVGKLSQRYGRRIGLATGFIVGGFGAIGVVMALTNSIILLLISLLIYGAGTATNLQARYAGTDLADKKQRATAVNTMVMTTFGAVAI